MFGTNDSDNEDQPDGGIEQDQPVDIEQEGPVDVRDEPLDADEQNVDSEPGVVSTEARLDELEEELESAESSIRTVRSSQDEMTDSLEEMNDTIRQLVGMYDRFAAADNPFVDGPEMATDDDSGPRAPGNGAAEQTASTANGDVMDAPDTETEPADDETVSFDDLREQTDDGPSEAPLEPVDGAHADAPADETDLGPVDGAHADAPADETDSEPVVSGGREATTTPATHATPVLESVPDGYAGDILVMEWLATLMDRSGPAGALRAVQHYETIGWISPAVRDHLVDVIGGPELDVLVDPAQPKEPTADDHAISHEYLQVLDRLSEL